MHIAAPVRPAVPPPIAPSHHATLTAGGASLVEKARETHRHASAFHHIIDEYCALMPGYLDRFHQAMEEFRDTANAMRDGMPPPRHQPPEG